MFKFVAFWYKRRNLDMSRQEQTDMHKIFWFLASDPSHAALNYRKMNEKKIFLGNINDTPYFLHERRVILNIIVLVV